MGTKTLILGGGAGGVVTANSLRALVPKEHEVLVVDRRTTFHLGAPKTWVMLGERTVPQVTRTLDSLRKRGIGLIQAEVQRIDAANREVQTSKGPLKADYLVIALGAHLNMGAVPGLEQAAHTFYTMEGAARLGEALKSFKGGDLVILNPRMPIQCPPAPYEVAMHLHHTFEARGIREDTRLSLYAVEPFPMPTAGSQVGQIIRDELAKRNIAYHPKKRVRSADAARRHLSFEDGSETRYDLLIAVPPHEAPQAVRDSGLTNASGWIPVDAKTLLTSFDRVYAIGDVTVVPLPGRYNPDVPLALPKAAVFAEAHGRVVAAQIAAQILGKEPAETFEGKGFCIVEMGAQTAMGGEGLFFEMPHPRVITRPADRRQFEEKLAWAENFLTRYL
ncbi:MAG TPA: FAD/NAD(P)-binding oxidoreductase [Candidatus Methylomirabilis sp.]|nr:FAD/NAD(P)-binding oxidoreductase [Candidatus Methylomirabilis sp.]